MAEPRNVEYDPRTGVLRLSMIFKWYQADFGADGVIAYLNRLRVGAPIPADARVEHRPYDWRLNSQPR